MTQNVYISAQSLTLPLQHTMFRCTGSQIDSAFRGAGAWFNAHCCDFASNRWVCSGLSVCCKRQVEQARSPTGSIPHAQISANCTSICPLPPQTQSSPHSTHARRFKLSATPRGQTPKLRALTHSTARAAEMTLSSCSWGQVRLCGAPDPTAPHPHESIPNLNPTPPQMGQS